MNRQLDGNSNCNLQKLCGESDRKSETGIWYDGWHDEVQRGVYGVNVEGCSGWGE